MDARERERLEKEVRELEALMAKGKVSQDPETCWAVYLLSRCLASRQKRLQQAAQET